jgi:uncharacterized membrane protein
VIDEAGITDTYYHITSGLERPASYFWRVNAANAYEVSEWSPIWFFWTSSPPAESVLRTELPEIKLPGFVQSLITRVPMLNPLAMEPLAQTALGLDFAAASPGGKVWRIFQYLVQLCLLIGFIRLVFRPAKLGDFKAEYLALTIVSLIILLGIFVLPLGMGATRIWEITLLLMSPLFIFGSEAIAHGIARLIRVFRKGFASFRSGYDSPALLRFSVLLIMIPYFTFNSGLVFELSRSQNTRFIDMPYSIALSSHRLDINTVFTGQDLTAATWLSNTAGDDYPVLNDYTSSFAFPYFFGDEEGPEHAWRHTRMSPFPVEVRDMTFPCYIYFRAWNINNKMLTFATGPAARQSVSFDCIPWLPQLVERGNAIYNNGGAQVLMPNSADR